MVKVLGLLITHKWAELDDLECASLGHTEDVLEDLRSHDVVKECALINTCHRVEVYICPKNYEKGRNFLEDFVFSRTKISEDEFNELTKFYSGERLIEHILRLSSGLESMVIGEDQILGQVKDAYHEGKKKDAIGDYLDLIFEKAINVGKSVRNETEINNGCVSIGSAAVKLAEDLSGELDKKKALVVGAGEMASIVVESLSEKNIDEITIANRTYERARRLSKKVDGNPISFDKFVDHIPKVDMILSATGAPHPILNKEDLIDLDLGKTLIVDISNPRDVEEEVEDIAEIDYHDIDSLRKVTEKNKKKRKREAKKAKEIIDREISNLKKKFKEKEAEDVVAQLHKKANRIRIKERNKAFNKMKVDKKQKQVIDDLSRSIVNKILTDPTRKLKEAAANGDKHILEDVNKIFNLDEEQK
ncbi:MAG: Glutamyl-tRNA reductase [Candidatus Methanohalarchaeum thermophilum]|uniref:Glutamyl-tRNA reductase n=1 Tax=Methanohalarchaeum thermophilum TaxID=1903181 RepID=A0A1Q6DS93_METT1|nr:MAG: Glutamyl-tRNA reductase [Candidatus Methanohalarchaeum thermophilum]